MKVFIAVDMEGATGVVNPDQLMPDGRGYASAQKLLTHDVLAVIKGIVNVHPDAEIRVGDGHGPMRNVLIEDLPFNVELVVGSGRPENKPLCQLEGIDNTFNAAILVGYHSKAGTYKGLLAHTYIGSLISDLRLQGVSVGEVEMNAAVLGHYGVPMIALIGNAELETELRRFSAETRFVATKTSLGPTAAICRPPSWTAREITSAVSESIAKSNVKPYNVGKTTIEVDMHRREQCDRACLQPFVTRVSEKTISVSANDAAEAFSLMWRACTATLDESPSWLA